MSSYALRNPGLERELNERDRVGLQDFILLEDYTNESVFLENLRKRFQENLIYTYIGQVLISVNPYKELPIYSEDAIKEYQGRHLFEAPPHVYAVSENAFRSLMGENKGQCILISGESGSGKTEASKKVLEFIAAASAHVSSVEGVKDKLLQTNPLLEAFGNAKTNRNDNSSRFGKYMDIEFSFKGAPEGGNILNYLLEKSRVVYQSPGERNFHIFYQLLIGGDENILKSLHLTRNITDYHYLNNKAKHTISQGRDLENFKVMRRAMDVIEISKEQQEEIFKIIASILHIGNIDFNNIEGKAKINNTNDISTIIQLLGCDSPKLTNSLTHRTIDARGEVITSPLTKEMALYARDALAKAIYDRLFTWLVKRLNESLCPTVRKTDDKVLGILDIYGFEIFEKNSFEQFCINFCNEKLQQLFIELTLKSEQEEYNKEGIEWVPVEYFDNKVICNLIEERHKGIISILDEECLRPGDPNDLTLLAKLNKQLGSHPHYICHSRASLAIQKTMERNDFRLVHYAGDVTYEVSGFLDKNNDLLFRDLKETMSSTKNSIVLSCFAESECQCKKRPETAVTQFRQSLNNLIDILMSKEPSYIRCIKPNNLQSPEVFDQELVLHQVKYLGLMENLRVRRAGFAYRRTYDMFLRRYKCLSKKTWPNYDGSSKEGVQILVNDLGFNPDDYRMGRTKIFIRFPKTLFQTEDAYQMKKHEIAAIIQSRWKGRKQRNIYLQQRAAAIQIQAYIRREIAKREACKRRDAIAKIRDYIKGFITRHDSPNKYNENFIANSKRSWLMRLSKNLPKNLLENQWINPPSHCSEASVHLRQMHRLHLSRIYRLNLNPEKKNQLELKVLAEKVFKGKKANYKSSVGKWFINDRVPQQLAIPAYNFVQANFKNEKLKYSTNCTKYDRHGYKPRDRFAFLSEKALYIVDAKTLKQKHRLPLDRIDFCVTNKYDDLVLVRIPLENKRDKGDLILKVPEIIEFCIWVLDVTQNMKIFTVWDADTIQHNLVKGKVGQIDIKTGVETSIKRSKSGHLLVVRYEIFMTNGFVTLYYTRDHRK